MRRLTCHEYDWLVAETARAPEVGEHREVHRLPEAIFEQLRALDRERSALGRRLETERSIFDWRERRAKVRSIVGVVEVGGWSIEILPKLHRAEAFERRNLLHMLVRAGKAPSRWLETAGQHTGEAGLMGYLTRLFVERLKREMQRGVPRAYRRTRNNRRVLKGKLQFGEHVARNSFREDRFYVEHDVFDADRPLNRLLKGACRVLVEQNLAPETRDDLRAILGHLDSVPDRPPERLLAERVHLDRTTERFESLLAFAELVLRGTAPGGVRGETEVFSLLFDMNRVFEDFVGDVLERTVAEASEPWNLHRNGDPETRPLAYETAPSRSAGDAAERSEDGVLDLEPDFVAERTSDTAPNRRIVVDTKWKELRPGKGPRDGVSRSDLLQMFAYAKRFDGDRTVLLYPAPSEDVSPKIYELPNGSGSQGASSTIETRFVDLAVELDCRSDRLESACLEWLEAPPSDAVE